MTLAYNKATGEIAISKLSQVEYNAFDGLALKWNKQMGALVGVATIEVLQAVAHFMTLPPVLKERLTTLTSELSRYEKERNNEEPEELYPYPIKAKMFKHQVRGANMALLKWGWINGT